MKAMERQETNPKVDAFIAQAGQWREGLIQLRRIALDMGLTEAFKWGKPCYTLGDKNVAILYAFKESCAIGFLKGSLLGNPDGLLVAPGENSQAMRMAKFTRVADILSRENVLKACLEEAVALEKAGVEVTFAKSAAPELPEELARELALDAALQNAFSALTPGRRRAYALYIGGAKQTATRAARVAKYRQKILDGKGIDD